MDLSGYFERLDYHGPVRADLATLRALTRAQAQTIAFENLDVLQGRPIRLDASSLYAKLVAGHRGGYCFELNGLLMLALRQLGFAVRPLSARVRLGTPDRAVPAARTHLVLEVSLDAETWITDVGVGGASLTAPLRLVADREQATPHDVRRLQHLPGRWFHQVLRGGQWVDVYEFSGETMAPIDRTVANWYTSTHPASKFRRALTVARARADGSRVSLHNAELAEHQADGSVRRRSVATPSELLQLLDEHFGLCLPAGTCFSLPDGKEPFLGRRGD